MFLPDQEAERPTGRHTSAGARRVVARSSRDAYASALNVQQRRHNERRERSGESASGIWRHAWLLVGEHGECVNADEDGEHSSNRGAKVEKEGPQRPAARVWIARDVAPDQAVMQDTERHGDYPGDKSKDDLLRQFSYWREWRVLCRARG